jgi:hypothetical protein
MNLLSIRLSPSALASPGAYAYICEEAGKPVGFALGKAATELRTAKDTSPRTCELLFGPHTMIAGRWDIYLALMERHAQNGIDTGHTYAIARLPTVGQCSNITDSATLAGELSTRIGLHWNDVGWDTARQVSDKVTEPVDLKAVLAALRARLDAVKCVRTWK